MSKTTREQMKSILSSFVLITLFFTALFIVLEVYPNRSKFNVGDCVKEVYETEFKYRVYYHKIIKVGKTMYMTDMTINDYTAKEHTEFKIDLNQYEITGPVNCP